jgi:hypothetical protein
MVRTLPNAQVNARFQNLFEVKWVPKSASASKFEAKFRSAQKDIAGYQTGDYTHWRGIAVCFRGNLDFKIEVVK